MSEARSSNLAPVRPVPVPDDPHPAVEPWIGGSKERLRLRLYAALIALDLGLICLAFIVANLVRFADPFHQQGRDMLVMLLPIFLPLAVNGRAYSVSTLDSPRKGIARTLQALLIAFAVVMGFLFYMKVGQVYSRIGLAVGMISSILFLGLARAWFGHWIGNKYKWAFVNQLLLVDSVKVHPRKDEIVLFADRANIKPSMDDPVMLDRIGRLLRHCDRVILACPPDRRALWSRMLKGMDVDAEVLAPELDELGALELRFSHGKPTLLVSCGPLGIRARAVKRLFDLTVATAAIILLSPLMLIVAAAIKLTSRGPIFFAQPRVGRGNRIFHVLKFRSMRSERGDTLGARSASRSDDRVTRVGRFIRKTSIDELPQLFNVLHGEMSIVGPRPHALASTAGDRLFWNVDDRYLERHIIKPGITGLAQVRGYRGATVTESDLVNRLQADLDYLSGWTIWRDCQILISTFMVLVHRNAY